MTSPRWSRCSSKRSSSGGRLPSSRRIAECGHRTKYRKTKASARKIQHARQSKLVFVEYKKRHIAWLEKRKREEAERKAREAEERRRKEEEERRRQEEEQRKREEEAAAAAAAVQQAKATAAARTHALRIPPLPSPPHPSPNAMHCKR